uniref:Exostosin GT47 domain-containing protein n=1 Tax=Kalanchoe fedtschenkoi TaxID=63787 RepID=A0A7N0RG78_KALFE
MFMEKPKPPNRHNHVCLIIFTSSFLASTMAYIYFSSTQDVFAGFSISHTLGSQNISSTTSMAPRQAPTNISTPPDQITSAEAAAPTPTSFTQQPNQTTQEALVPVPEEEPIHHGDSGAADPCSGRYIFIHQLPPRFNYELLSDCQKLLPTCDYLQNDGFGPPIFRGPTGDGGFKPESWFATNQFTLELIFHKRMKQYECLTGNSSSADALYVPFYAGLEVGRHLWGYNTTIRDRMSVELLSYISSLKEWKVMDGRDHFLVAGRIGWDFRRYGNNDSDWGSSLMLQPQSKHMTMLTIEATNSKKDVGVPYPTYFHPSTSQQIHQWQKSIGRSKRKSLFAFAGAPRPLQPGSIRNELFKQCSAARKRCLLLSCFNTYDPKCHSPVNVLTIFRKAKFCLQPPGDSVTRRSTFDSIISGCIPVFFRMESGPEQYVWHFPKNYTSYSVYIPEEEVQRKKADIRRILSMIPPEKVKAMRREVIKMIPRVIYRNARGGDGLGQKDAFDVAVEGILNRVRNIKREFSNGIETGLYF